MEKGKRVRTNPDIPEDPRCDLVNAGQFDLKDGIGSAAVRLVKTDRYIQILLLLTVVGGVLRFYNLGFNSIWLDEAATLQFAKQGLFQIWQTTAAGEFNPPLFNWIEHAMLLFGVGETQLRFIPALVGTLTIPCLYLLGREAVDRNTGLIAAALLTFSPFHLAYSQEARAYSLMLFFLIIAAWFAFRAVKQEKRNDFLLFGVFCAFSVYTHFYSYVMVGILFVWSLVVLLFRYRSQVPRIIPWFLGLGVFLVISLPIIILTGSLYLLRTSKPVTYGTQGVALIIDSVIQLSGIVEYSALIVIVLAIAGAVSLWKKEKPTLFFLVLSLFLTFVFSLVLSYKMPMLTRYLIFLLPVIFIAAGASWRYLCPVFRDGKAVYILLAVALVINIPTITGYYSGYQKEDWRGFAGSLSSLTAKGDLIVVLPGYISMPFDYYYSNTTDGTIEVPATTRAELEQIVTTYPDRRVFYVLTNDLMAADPEGGALSWLEARKGELGTYNGIYLIAGRT